MILRFHVSFPQYLLSNILKVGEDFPSLWFFQMTLGFKKKNTNTNYFLTETDSLTHLATGAHTETYLAVSIQNFNCYRH